MTVLKQPRLSTAIALLALAPWGSAPIVGASPIPDTAVKPQYVKLDLEKSWGEWEEALDPSPAGTGWGGWEKAIDSHDKRPAKRSLLHKRSHPVKFDMKNREVYYSVNVTVGTPEQAMTVLLDTGSSDLWVVGSDVKCTPRLKEDPTCKALGTFNTNNSCTWSGNGTRFSIEYADSSFARGEWGMDVVHVNGLKVDGLTFAVADEAASSVGVFGIGLTGLETTNEVEPPHSYDNFPLLLKRNGVIASNSYSLYTNQYNAEYGSILFGGVDHKKYKGKLLTVPIINTDPKRSSVPTSLSVTLNGVTYSTAENKTDTIHSPIGALLDSGTTLSYFPKEIADAMAVAVGAQWSEQFGSYVRKCPADNDKSTLDFNFSGNKIRVPIDDYSIYTSVPGLCAFGFMPYGGDIAILGDVFLTAAYVVYDLDRLEISIAEANYSTAEEIEPIVSGVPRAEKAPGYSNVWVPNNQK
ncbi:HHL314Wp [Eremothecium sinecaudum]|uniref:HHL314Wp n=1 Tax=Eremothecium sinecaudum TaxID=45286 RepID=A0A109V091_9SACH|nr:HHL314Wp [Eremothecium sinecaudum]AMD22456.1 HHL314Wp [Eremothecium sinecaudum]